MASTVQLLEDAGVKLSRLNVEEAKAYQLDICLGGSSEVHPRKSIERYLILTILLSYSQLLNYSLPTMSLYEKDMFPFTSVLIDNTLCLS